MLWKSQVIIIKIMSYEGFYAFVLLAVLPGLQHRPQSYSVDIQSLFKLPLLSNTYPLPFLLLPPVAV